MNFEKRSDGIYENTDGGAALIKKYVHPLVLKSASGSCLTVGNNIWLAPLAGITDLPFRLLCKQCARMAGGGGDDAPGLVFTEMISAKGLHYKGNNSILLAESEPEEKPVSMQIFGSEPDIMAEGAAILEEAGANAIDINMGCPVPKITSNSEGSALLRDPVLIEKIVSAVSGAVHIPVTVKMRRGFEGEKETCVEAALAAEAGGAAAITVHGRFREQYYSGKCSRDAVKRVKEAVKIPVIGNGDIASSRQALEMFEYTGCDGIMIGRAALGRPWIFYSLLNEDFRAPDPNEIYRIIKLHIEYASEHMGEERGMREMRKHLAWYTKGMPNAAETRNRIFKAATAEETINIARECILRNV